MNTLEERLREALADRAAHSPIDQDAWNKTLARSQRRLRLSLPGWLPAGFLVPATAAVAVIAVVLAAVALTGGARGAGTGAPAGGATPPPPGTPRQVTDVLRGHPAVTAVVSATLGGDRVYAWFSNLKNYHVCYVVVSASAAGSGYKCGGWPAGWYGQLVYSQSSVGQVNAGKAMREVTSVTTRPSNGGSIAGAVVSGRGFPFKLWFAIVPSARDAEEVFRDATGKEVWSFDYAPASASGVPTRAGIIVNGWTAFLTDGKVLWRGPDNGAVVALPWTVKQKPLMVLYQQTSATNYVLGYAPADVARLVLRMPDGHEYGGPTVTGWPRSGERLWVRSGLPDGGLPSGTVVISYNAAGQVIGRESVGSLLGT